jgi:molybdopterin-guanine dinucleotide biosynthesis protein A
MRNLIGFLILASVALVLVRVGPPALSAIRSARGSTLENATADGSRAAQGSLASPRAQTTSVPPLRVLFVGNSHTYLNDMPSMIVQLAAAAKQRRGVELSLLVAGGATLAEHLAGDQLRARLNSGHWDYVVLQDQQQRPSQTSPQLLDSEFFAPIRTLDVLIRAASAKTILFMTAARLDGDAPFLPSDTYEKMQQRTVDAYSRVASELGATVAPVGLAWRWAHERRPDLQLWAADRYHPAPAGSYLAACVFYEVLYGSTVLDNPFTAGLPASDASLLQRAAETARFL